MKFSDVDLTTQDIDWFAVDMNGNIGQFATGGSGFVPESVVASVENNDELLDYFYDINDTSKIQIIEENLPKLNCHCTSLLFLNNVYTARERE